MKTWMFLKDQMSDNMTEMVNLRKIIGSKNSTPDDVRKSKQKFNKLKKRGAGIKLLMMYLETNPSEDFLRKEHARISNRISLLMDDCVQGEREMNIKYKARLKKYCKEMGVDKLKTQLSAINYILK